jgi:CBS domain-containing protein
MSASAPAATGPSGARHLLLATRSRDVQWCYEEQSVEEAAQLMRDAQIRRLPIADHDRKLVGVVSLGDLAAKGGEA